MNRLLLPLLLVLFSFMVMPQEKTLLIRCDDIGMSHSINMAIDTLAKTGIPLSASVMFACPWYQEGVEILKKYPHIAVGIHLTLNSEWKEYRWGPVAGKSLVPSLVDKNGYFFPSRKLLFENNPKIEEFEIELRAQIERALQSGIQISYMDFHMGAAVTTKELRQLVEKLAAEYGFGLTRYFGEKDLKNVYNDAPDQKTNALGAIIRDAELPEKGLLVCHIGIDNDELAAMTDLNAGGLSEMSKHRQAELDALLSEEFHQALKEQGIRLVNYRDVIQNEGLQSMRRNEE